MKVFTEEPKAFKPITIVLETPQEARALLDMLSGPLPDSWTVHVKEALSLMYKLTEVMQ